MGKTIAFLCMLISSSANAGAWNDRYWNYEYQRQQSQRFIQMQQMEAEECWNNISRLREMVGRFGNTPDGRYYAYQLRSWTARCAEASRNNPYIRQ